MSSQSKKMRVLFAAAIMAGLGSSAAWASEPNIKKAEKKIVTTTTVYDSVGQVIVTTDPVGHTTTYDYDSNGSNSTTSGGNTTTYTYDSADRATTPSSGPTSYTYDATGNDTTTVNGSSTNGSDGGTGATQTDSDALGFSTRYQYDSGSGAGSTTETDPLGRTTTYMYDGLNRPTGVSGSDPEGNTTSYTYDAVNRKIEETDSLGNVTTNNYDTQSSGTVDIDGLTTTYQYDMQGRMTAMDAGSSVDITLYDTTDSANRITIFEYDSTTPDALGITTTYQYDSTNRIISGGGTMTGSPEGDLLPGHTYQYQYSYDLNNTLSQTGSGDVANELDLTPVPEPTSAAIAMMGGLMLMRRHRRRY